MTPGQSWRLVTLASDSSRKANANSAPFKREREREAADVERQAANTGRDQARQRDRDDLEDADREQQSAARAGASPASGTVIVRHLVDLVNVVLERVVIARPTTAIRARRPRRRARCRSDGRSSALRR